MLNLVVRQETARLQKVNSTAVCVDDDDRGSSEAVNCPYKTQPKYGHLTSVGAVCTVTIPLNLSYGPMLCHCSNEYGSHEPETLRKNHLVS
jgi:hypothetical protein